MSEMQVYMWLILDNVSTIFIILAIFGTAFVGFAVSFCTVIGFTDREPKLFFAWLLVPMIIPIILLATFTPTSKQYAMIKVFPQIINSDIAQDIPEDMNTMYTMAKDYMKEMLSDS